MYFSRNVQYSTQTNIHCIGQHRRLPAALHLDMFDAGILNLLLVVEAVGVCEIHKNTHIHLQTGTYNHLLHLIASISLQECLI